ncbi:Hypothetical predicted protein [Prunus dulcis]|uniref:Uncharacterized protein n=1 Tax=Prunus dulcis TaxID=3755 RepID=A0A5E4ER48_PRUDU|nr:hypothetical protein L3X38_001886 [Prunus dulcis]VVA18154.1 Hypothetical predicted protein [Prunus dulcis]
MASPNSSLGLGLFILDRKLTQFNTITKDRKLTPFNAVHQTEGMIDATGYDRASKMSVHLWSHKESQWSGRCLHARSLIHTFSLQVRLRRPLIDTRGSTSGRLYCSYIKDV